MASNGSLRNVSSKSGSALPKYGLIVKGKKDPPANTIANTGASGTKFTLGKKLSRAKVFEAPDSDSDQEQEDESITSFSASAGGRTDEQKRVNKELRAVQAQRSRLAEEEHKKALEEDPSVFDYDAVYDDLKRAELEKKKSKDNPDGGIVKKPRYMAALIKASAKRKIELERAELRKVQREREEEGEQFGDKEKFVTGAYKQQVAELKRIEEEEKRREALERDVTKGGDMTAFYRDILNQSDRDPLVINPKTNKDDTPQEEVEEMDIQDDTLKKEAIRKGLVQLNDSEEVVDKRQLLSGGLNLTSRTVKRQAQEREEREREARQYAAKKAEEERARLMERRAAKEQQARARELVLRQQQEKEEEDRKRKEREQEELARKLARKTTDETVSDARARYLARKKAQAQQPEEDSD
ncbi:uncharacterized protein SPPG_04294 [Spizellomyces punctatus DAOM BR117]|uniref:Nuclear speckle splicing regulatory protein 1 N-terminal domain-containing protein n=1 Tax=Spizellomyces punctatus (strain DAOM BR117) TaxID=645134 RepID=A0A0L0HK54_SPIPD|nr:uncharacterized protein SPPG_04294 [Spizellomyces punctatus DAOM BR117]KND01204.1 hypothetical protein SPPG_04294 [Spizellomyces punctatus DAOM BR117]|eukprot:XP_016609243.1 hypothetical protein SPPG_04294 [Spizellomyces punctatus DAOM BR117]